MAERRIALPGSERTRLEGARVVGVFNPDERFTVTVVLKPSSPVPPPAGRFLSRSEFAARHGASPAAMATVRRFAQEHGLSIISENAAARTMELAASSA